MEKDTVTHLDEGALMALVDGELMEPDAAALEAHLEECAECRVALESLRADRARLSGALRLLDREPPTEMAHQRLRRTRRSRSGTGRPLRWAAVIVVGTATALAATVPGSPLREWIASVGDDPPVVVAVDERSEMAVETARAPAAPAGVSVVPRAGRMLVSFTGASEGLRIRLHVHDGDEVEVLTSGGAEQARFHTAPERIEVRDAGRGEASVEIPRGLAEFTLEVDGRVFMAKRGEDLRFPGPPADTVGPAIVFEVRP